MGDKVLSPFDRADAILDNNEYDLAILDFHAETTSEKKVLSFYLKDKVQIFYGTHTHIQTADEYILDDQAYITDVGMTGIMNSAIGVEYEAVVSKLRNNIHSRFIEKKEGIMMFNAILVTVYDNTFKPFKIERLNIKY